LFFGQVTLAQVLFFGDVRVWLPQVLKIGFVSLVKSFGKFGSGWLVKIRSARKVVFSICKGFVSQAFWSVVFFW
jgi:hypothetical protein